MYIYLDIVKQFVCRQCGACCSRDWLVTVDEAGYRRNEQLFASQGERAEFQQVFAPLGQSADYGEYAKIAKRADGACWFLTEDRLCRLQKMAGPEHLDSVCQWFPRYPMDTERGIEISLSFSCPAAVRLAVREKPLEICRTEASPLELAPTEFVTQVYPGQQPWRDPMHYYFELEQHLIDLLQLRNLSLPERLALVRQMAQQCDAMQASDTLGEEINRIVRANYAAADALAESGHGELDGPCNWLLENFFVNFVFRKTFYRYGFGGGLRRLQAIEAQLADFLQLQDKGHESPEALIDRIVEIELVYNHGGQSFLPVK